MITVLETIHLRPEFANANDATHIAQEYDEQLHDNAHTADGYLDHAAFFFTAPDRLIILYPWRDEASAAALIESERPLLADWLEKYSGASRDVEFLGELAVEL